jgi:hypothetical protein
MTAHQDAPQTYPESVYTLGAWLKARPWVKRVKVDTATFWAYIAEVQLSQRLTPSYDPHTPIDPVLFWRHQQAIIPESDWYRRESLFPSRIYRKSA